MPRFRKRPVIVTAWQYVGVESLGQPGVFVDEEDRHYVVTIHGQRAYLAIGDWVIAEPDGLHFYPCKPAIFAATYEPVVGDDLDQRHGDIIGELIDRELEARAAVEGVTVDELCARRAAESEP